MCGGRVEDGYMSLRSKIANVTTKEPATWDEDNLAIALGTYFSDRDDRPENDEEGESGWGKWVEEQVDAVLDRIVTVVKEHTKIVAAENERLKRANDTLRKLIRGAQIPVQNLIDAGVLEGTST